METRDKWYSCRFHHHRNIGIAIEPLIFRQVLSSLFKTKTFILPVRDSLAHMNNRTHVNNICSWQIYIYWPRNVLLFYGRRVCGQAIFILLPDSTVTAVAAAALTPVIYVTDE